MGSPSNPITQNNPITPVAALSCAFQVKMCSLHVILSPAAPKARDVRYCNALLSVRPSVCPSHLVFALKTHCCIFSKLCWYVHHVMGVCCIVFDIDGMLFEFCMIFFLSKKNKHFLRILLFSFHVFFAFYAISNICRKNSISNIFLKLKKIAGRG